MSNAVKESRDVRAFRVEDLPSIWSYELKQEWLVENIIPVASVTMLSGESGSGKSSIALALAAAVANGEPFLGRATKKCPVLISDRENNQGVYVERLRRFDIKENPELRVWGHFSPVEPAGPNGHAIIEYATAQKPLIIFDSYIAFHNGNEQDAYETRIYTDYFRKLAGVGATVIVIHHTGKGENTKEYRGSSDIKASLDMGFVLTAKKPRLQLLKLHAFKCREGDPEDILITLDGTKFVELSKEFVEPEDVDWQAVINVIKDSPAITQNQIIKRLLHIPERKIRKIIMAARLKGAIVESTGPSNAKLISVV